MRISLAALCGRFHGYVRKLEIALTVSMAVRLLGPLAFDPSEMVVALRAAHCVQVLYRCASMSHVTSLRNLPVIARETCIIEAVR